MKDFRFIIFVVSIYVWFFDAGSSADVKKCIFANNTKNDDKLNVISTLVGQNFATEKDGYKYIVSICSDIPKEKEFVSVIQSKNKDTTVLGRRNESYLFHGENWLVLSYGSGDFKSEKKELVQRRASIYFVCSPEEDDNQIHLVEENGREYKFILPTQNVCYYSNEMSGMKVFFILLTVSLSAYCLIGIIYRRCVHNAQNYQQIPHYKFWSKIGNSLADGCNYICRCDSEPEDSWNNITSNFENGDRDDALLRP